MGQGPIRQSNFSNGELAPELHADTNATQYHQSVAHLKNSIPTSFGAIVDRSGTLFVGETKDSSKTSRIVPFIFGGDQSYVLEFGGQYVRVWSKAAPVGREHLVAGGVGTMIQSEDAGVSFSTTGMVDPPAEVHSIAHNGDYYVAVGFDGTTYYFYKSLDGRAWTSVAAGKPYRSVVWTGSQWIACGGRSATPTFYSCISTSPDGVTWTPATVAGPSGANVAWHCIAVGSGHVIMVGGVNETSSGVAAVSGDGGATWTVSYLGTNSCAFGVTWTGTSFVAVGGYAVDNQLRAWRSANEGTSWTPIAVGAAGSGQDTFYGVASNGAAGVLAVGRDNAGADRHYYSADDGLTWNRKGPGSFKGRGVCWDAGAQAFIVVGETGAVTRYLSGTDTWEATQTIGTDTRYAVQKGPGGAGALEVATPYAEGDLRRLKCVQSGDTLVICHPAYAPRELRRYGHASWALAEIAVTRSLSAPTGLTATSTVPGTPPSGWPTKPRSWVVTAVDANGEESLPSTPYAPALISRYPQTPVALSWAAVTGAVRYHVYAGRNGLMGWVGTSTTAAFNDDGQDPDYSDGPPVGRNPFGTANDYPACATYDGARLVFGNTVNRPATTFGSQLGALHNFDVSEVAKSSDAYTWGIASRRWEEIRSLVPMGKLLAFTSGAEWQLVGSNGPIGPTSFGAVPQSYFGSSWLDPIAIGASILFVPFSEASVRELGYSAEAGGYVGGDASAPANHLFRGRRVVAWDYQQKPYSLVWAVLDDGTLLSLTWVKERGVSGWAHHDTQGCFEDVCVVPEGTETVVYLLANRTINGATKRYVEKFASREIADVRTGVLSDCAITYDAAPATVFSGLGYLEGMLVEVLADGVPTTATVASGAITLSKAASKVVVGLKYVPEGELLDVASAEIRTRAKLIRRVTLEVEATRGYLSIGESITGTLKKVEPELTLKAGDSGLWAGQINMKPEGSWNRGGRIAWRRDAPLPLKILAVTRETEVGT